jgi:hypothetical protein
VDWYNSLDLNMAATNRKPFDVTVRTATHRFSYTALAVSSSAAWTDAADAQGDTPCAITVKPVGAKS